MREHDEREWYTSLMPVNMEVGSHRQDQPNKRHDGAVHREPVATEQDHARHEHRQKRDSDVGAVLEGSLEGDLSLGVPFGHIRIAATGFTELEMLVHGRNDETSGIT